MGWMDSTPYGSEYYETPNVARLAARGMLFTDAYTAHPLCSPTRASIMTGKYPARHGITSAVGHTQPDPPGTPRYPDKASPQSQTIQPRPLRFLDPDEFTLAEALRSAGYKTAHIGKWHLGLNPEHWPEAQGFEVSFHGAPDPGPPSYHSPYGFKAGTVTDGPEGEYITDRITGEAVAFIEGNKDNPWFLNLWQYGVHGPWGHKEEYTKYFSKKKDPRGMQDNPIMASMLKSVDESLGRVLDTLDELGIAENTLIVFTSDNGGNTHSNIESDAKTANIKEGHPRWEKIADYRKWAGFKPPTNNAPLRAGKAWLYEGGCRVPLIVSWPEHVEPGSRSGAVAGSPDLYPTILEAVGLDPIPEQHVDGISLVPVLEGRVSQARKFFPNFFPHGGPGRPPGVTVRYGDWKLIRWFETSENYPDEFELYNLAEDIGETKNRAMENPEQLAKLTVLIESFLVDTDALVPKPNPDYRENSFGGADDPLLGWVPKKCDVVVEDGALKITATGNDPFIAQVRFTALKKEGPYSLRIQLRAPSGGAGKIQWRTADQETFPATGQTASFDLSAEENIQDRRIAMPVNGRLSHIRLFLPATAAVPVDIESIELLPNAPAAGQPLAAWRFGQR